MRLFRNCRYLSGVSVEEILALTAHASANETIRAVGDTVRAAKQVPLADGRRVPSVQIDDLIARLRA